MLRSLGTAATLATTLREADALAPGDETKRRPNIVLVMSDQHAAHYCGFMGHPIVRTPNMDRIAARGVVFRNTYCGSPVCTPSRAGMLSGVYPSDCDSFCNSTVWDGKLPTWPGLLRDAGYHTFGTGKMDARGDHDLGFDESPNLGNGHWSNPDITSLFRRPLGYRVDERRIVNGDSRTKRHGDGALAVVSIDFIRKQTPGGKPWAIYCGPHMPHDPFVGLKEYYDDYLPRVDLPNVTPEALESQHVVFNQLRHFKDIATPIPEERIRRARAAYYAMVTELDGYVGQIWDALAATGQLENTIFVYTSDHGESLGEHGLWLKNNLYDVAARVPLLVAGAGIPQGVTVQTPVAHVDLIRTFLEWGGAKTHGKLRGHSLTPLMHGQPGDHPGWAYTESHSEGNGTGSFQVRKGDWKYIHFTYYDGLLFNLGDDPGETRNRIDDPAAQEVLKELQAILSTQANPVEITERAFRAQKKRLDELAKGKTPDQLLDQLRGRLGEGQAVNLMTAYYGKPFAYTHKKPSAGGDREA